MPRKPRPLDPNDAIWETAARALRACWGSEEIQAQAAAMEAEMANWRRQWNDRIDQLEQWTGDDDA